MKNETVIKDYNLEEMVGAKVNPEEIEEVTSPTNKEISGPKPVKGTITNNLVRVREEPSYDGKTVMRVNKGEMVDILGDINDFYKVRIKHMFNDGNYYISKKFCKKVE